jgi:hypothetical protein
MAEVTAAVAISHLAMTAIGGKLVVGHERRGSRRRAKAESDNPRSETKELERKVDKIIRQTQGSDKAGTGHGILASFPTPSPLLNDKCQPTVLTFGSMLRFLVPLSQTPSYAMNNKLLMHSSPETNDLLLLCGVPVLECTSGKKKRSWKGQLLSCSPCFAGRPTMTQGTRAAPSGLLCACSCGREGGGGACKQFLTDYVSKKEQKVVESVVASVLHILDAAIEEVPLRACLVFVFPYFLTELLSSLDPLHLSTLASTMFLHTYI